MLAEAVTVQDAGGRMVYANTAAAQLLGCDTVEELLATPRRARGALRDHRRRRQPGGFEDLPSIRLLAGRDAPALLTRSVHRASGRVYWLMTKATLLDDGGERMAVNIIEDVTASR